MLFLKNGVYPTVLRVTIRNFSLYHTHTNVHLLSRLLIIYIIQGKLVKETSEMEELKKTLDE